MGTIASQITSLASDYSTVYSGADQRKHQSSASLAFMWGIHPGPVNFPHKWPVTRKMFPFDDVIMGPLKDILYSLPQLSVWLFKKAPSFLDDGCREALKPQFLTWTLNFISWILSLLCFLPQPTWYTISIEVKKCGVICKSKFGCICCLRQYCVVCDILTLKHRDTHGCVVSTVATDALVLKHQAISIHNAD